MMPRPFKAALCRVCCCDRPLLSVQHYVPGVNRMTEVTISEQMTRMTRRAIAIPFQFLCGGLLPTSSCRERDREEEKRHGEEKSEKNTNNLWDPRQKETREEA